MTKGRFLVVPFMLLALVLVSGRAPATQILAAVRLDGRDFPLASPQDLRLDQRGELTTLIADGKVLGVKMEFKSIAWYLVEPALLNKAEFREKRLDDLDGRRSVPLAELLEAVGAPGAPGTYRFRVEAELTDGRVLSSGQGKNALRLTFRRDDSYLGWLETYRRVPYKYGSTQAEVRDHLAADCADFVAAGYLKMGGAKLGDMGTMTMLTVWGCFFDVIHQAVDRLGDSYPDLDTGRPVTFGPGGVRPGDIVLYKGHTGVIFGDRGRPGVLDPADPVLHHLYVPPRESPLEDVWTGPFAVIRWKDFTPWQDRLARAGYYQGPINGVFNAELEDAVRRFQRQHGLKAHARPDGPTWTVLTKKTK